MQQEEHRKKRRKIILAILTGFTLFLAGASLLLYSNYYISPRFKASMRLIYPGNSTGEVELFGASSEKIYYTVEARGGPFNITLVFKDANGFTVGATQLEEVSESRAGLLHLEGFPSRFTATAECSSCQGEVSVSVHYAKFDRSAYTAAVVLGSILAMCGAITLGLGSWLIVYEGRTQSSRFRDVALTAELPSEHPSGDNQGIPHWCKGWSVA